MTPDMLSAFFGWMLLLNLALYATSALIVFALRDRIAAFQGRLFGMAPAAIRQIIYTWLGAWKLLVIVVCLVPWLALRIIA